MIMAFADQALPRANSAIRMASAAPRGRVNGRQEPVMSERLCAVAIMAKASIAGAVKTRLVPPLTPEEAAELNSCFLADVAANIATAATRAPIQGFTAYHPWGSERFFAALLPDG